LEEGCFLDQYGEQPLVTARFNFYPPCPRPDRILGVKPHADASAVTFLLQDKEVEGLQFLKATSGLESQSFHMLICKVNR
jgi:isopenicillin N synthase-like dioxygenase